MAKSNPSRRPRAAFGGVLRQLRALLRGRAESATARGPGCRRSSGHGETRPGVEVVGLDRGSQREREVDPAVDRLRPCVASSPSRCQLRSIPHRQPHVRPGEAAVRGVSAATTRAPPPAPGRRSRSRCRTHPARRTCQSRSTTVNRRRAERPTNLVAETGTGRRSEMTRRRADRRPSGRQRHRG